ncbi:MAG TPA: methylated-DNA--[protein]-cysteine S-methyltransferase [Solirubrobacterales bacterium]|nr:methylated-DNA--[protein]-cysteine S-methyltransferase [Solirubrobacterales bacterium]
MNAVRYESPIGVLTLVGTDSHLVALQFPGRLATPAQGDPNVLAPAIVQLDEYFSGERRTFELRLHLKGTKFQQRVWAALREIPFGETTSYGAIARKLSEEVGERFDPRGVGGAVGSTPVPIIVPCHRVIGADGSLTGYGGGLSRKRALLDFENTGGNTAALDKDWGKQLTLA